MKKLINISQLAIARKLVDQKINKPLNYILRYWEKEFKQIMPKIINKRSDFNFVFKYSIKFITLFVGFNVVLGNKK